MILSCNWAGKDLAMEFLMDNDIILLEGQEYFTKMAMDVSSVLDIVRKKGYFKTCGKFNIYYEF